MEDFNAFMDFSKKPKKKCLEGGSTVAQMVDNPQKWGAHGSEPNLKRKLPKRFAKAYVRRFKDDVFEVSRVCLYWAHKYFYSQQMSNFVALS